MSGNSSLFSTLHQFVPMPTVFLADGFSINVHGVRSASPLPSVSLPSVLYFPSFFLSLLSVSKLTKLLNCSVYFDPTSVTIQDLKTWTVIGTGHESQGLYYLHPTSPHINATTATPLQIHCRLGHPSVSNLQLMVPSLGYVLHILCESCQLGKYSRTQFSSRINKRVSAPFELVHSDIWRLSRTVSRSGF